MAEVLSLAGDVGGIGALLLVLAYVVAPEAIRAWRARNHGAAEVAMRADRETTARHRIDAEGHALAAELVRERADEHRACREEVAELRVTITDCQRKHAESDARATALEAIVADLRGAVSWMQTQIETLRRDSQRPSEGAAE